MATYTKVKLSTAPTYGRAAEVATYAAPIHVTTTSATTIDEIWLWVSNVTAADQDIILYGGDGSGGYDPWSTLTVPARTTMLVLPGAILTGDGSSSGSIYGESLGFQALWYFGYVNRIA